MDKKRQGEHRKVVPSPLSTKERLARDIEALSRAKNDEALGAMARMNMEDRRITEAEVEWVLDHPTSTEPKGKTVDISGTLTNGRRIIVRVERDTVPQNVVAVISPSDNGTRRRRG